MERIHQTCIEMLTQRGYTITKDENNVIIAEKDNNGTPQQICAFTEPAAKFNIDKVHQYIALLGNMGITHAIVPYNGTVTHVAKKVVQNSGDIVIELFKSNELMNNITKSQFVPLHERTSPEEAAAFKAKYGDVIPELISTRPISRFYGYHRGDIIRITRDNGYVTYRIVR